MIDSPRLKAFMLPRTFIPLLSTIVLTIFVCIFEIDIFNRHKVKQFDFIFQTNLLFFKPFCFMKGSELKDKLVACGYTLTFIAEKMNTIPQNLNSWFKAEDVKTGTLEKLSETLGLPISYFYGESYRNVSTVSGNNNTSVAGNSNTVGRSDDLLLQLLKSKDDQLTRAQLQIDELLQIIKERR